MNCGDYNKHDEKIVFNYNTNLKKSNNKEINNEIESRTSEASKSIFSNNQNTPTLNIREIKSEKINTNSHNSENNYKELENTIEINLISKKNIPNSETEKILQSPSHESKIIKDEPNEVNQNQKSIIGTSKYSSMSEDQLTEALDDENTPNEDLNEIFKILEEMDEKACKRLNEGKSNIENIEEKNKSIEEKNKNIEEKKENLGEKKENLGEKINKTKNINSKELSIKINKGKKVKIINMEKGRLEIPEENKFNRDKEFFCKMDEKTGRAKVSKRVARYLNANKIKTIPTEVEKGVFKEVPITELVILDDEEIEKMKHEYIKYYNLIYPTQTEKKSNEELDSESRNLNIKHEARDSKINSNTNNNFKQKIRTYSDSKIDSINGKTIKEINEERIQNSEKEMDLKEEKIKKITNKFYMEMNEIKGTNLLEDVVNFDEKLSQLKVNVFKEKNAYKADLKKLIENKILMKIPLQTLRKFNQFSISTIKEIKNVLKYSDSKKMVVLQTVEELLKTQKEASSIIKGFLSEAGIESATENLGNYGKTV